MIEVRVVTFQRPDWLRRALSSLIAQSRSDWAAVVLDDSPEREGQGVVDALADPRISYRPNPVNLGCAANIDQAFRREPFVADYRYACILEDDNWFAAEFLAANIAVMESRDASLLLRDQLVFEENRGTIRTFSRTTRDMMAEGWWDLERLAPQMVFHCGLSNGGLMWRRDCDTELVVGPEVHNSNWQEHLRSLQLRDRMWMAGEPLAWFRFEAKGSSQQGLLARARSLRAT